MRTPVSRTEPRGGRAGRVAVSIGALAVVGALLAGCTANDPLAEQYRSGSGQGFISGDGAYTLVAQADRAAPVSFTGVVESGETFSSGDYLGQVLVVNFWYAGCPPCRLEAPDLQALSEQFARDGVQFIGINIYDQAATATAFATEFGITYPSILDINDGGARLAFAGQIAPNAVPTTLVVDAEGRVAARVSGLLTEPSVLRSMITDTLAEAS